MVSRIDNRDRSTRASAAPESDVREANETAGVVETETPSSIDVGAAVSAPEFRPSVEAVETSREALRHSQQTSQMRDRLNQALDSSTEPQSARSRTSQRYNRIRPEANRTDPPAGATNRGERQNTAATTPSGSGLGGAMQTTPEGFHVDPDGVHVFTGTRGDDVYNVSQAADGSLTVTNQGSGSAYSLPGHEAIQGVVIRGLDGDDNITIDGSVSHDLAVFAGGGNDVVDGSQATGELMLDGGEGDDTLRGGFNMDIINGGRGDDRLYGGYGNDQVNGQDGDDDVFGEQGHDFVSGGRGSDIVDGGRGSDAIYADAHDSRIDAGGSGRRGVLMTDNDVDTIVTTEGALNLRNVGANDVVATYNADEAQAYLDAHPEFEVEGDQDFQDRILADIGVMLGTQQGRGILDELSADLVANGESYRLFEREDGPGGSVRFSSADIDTGNFASTYFADGSPRHPLPVLFHELAHVYQDRISGIPEGHTLLNTGQTVRNIELQATGLPWIDAQGTLHPADELPYTDNRFRAELGLPLRQAYGASIGQPSSYSPVEVGHDGHDHDHEHAA